MTKMSLFPEIDNRMDADTFDTLLEHLELTHATLASRLDVDRRTITRWSQGEVPVPGSVALLLRVALFTQSLGHTWRGPGLAAHDTPTTRVK